MISKILIANRGEIVGRVVKTARKMGISTVSIFSNADTRSPFVGFTDESFYIGGHSAKDSYISFDKVLNAIKTSGANAVHPGYGFLSENSAFVRLLEKEGINFIGPSADSMDMLGDKIKSKQIAKNAGVSIVPGSDGEVDSLEEAIEIIDQIGLPVIIKASAGGGGKGMKIVYSKDKVKDAIISAKNEAINNFGDDRILIEKFVENPRHIEMQIIGDKFGNILCFGERECSIQRFNQKVIEEAPSVFIDEHTRNKMMEQCKLLASKCNYYSAGTVEFVVDQDRNFYFLEMNTRLQVEHPVSEFITGFDFVELMIKVANGEKLPIEQKDIFLTGSSIECRIYAEDPSRSFLPSIGRITHYKEPQKANNVRVDSGVISGSEISPYYDAMIAKLITYGDSRTEAIESMKDALAEYEVDGISTNIDFLESIIMHDDFISGNFNTSFIKKNYPNGFENPPLNNIMTKAFVLSAVMMYIESEKRRYKNNPTIEDIIVMIDNNCYDISRISISETNDNKKCLNVKYMNEMITFINDYKFGQRMIKAKIDNDNIIMRSKIDKGLFYLNSRGIKVIANVVPKHVSPFIKYISVGDQKKKKTTIKSPITGKIIKIFVSEGQEVKRGEEIILIEAMKMENMIRAEFDFVVKEIIKSPEDSVSSGEIIFKC